MTRNEDNANVEALYWTIENIKNDRIDSTFYGRFKLPHVMVSTNNVPNINMSTLSLDRFHLFACMDKDHNHIIIKCEVNLKIDTSSKFLVTWYSKSRISSDKDQEEFYEKILSVDETKIIISALKNGYIKKKTV